MKLEAPAQTSPLMAATTRWPSEERFTACVVVRSSPAIRPFESDDSNEMAGLDRSTSTMLTAWLPALVTIRPWSYWTPGAIGSRLVEV